MLEARHVWSLVLAGGDGNRLRALTTRPCGTSVPKQYCSLHGGQSLLEDAIARAQRVVAPDRVCTIVAQQHREWWTESQALLEALERGNLIVQPRNLGTGIGILYSLLHLLAKDPQAQLVLLPADHYVRDETTLNGALRQALERLDRNADRPILLGLQPDEPDTDFGYVLPGDPDPLGGHLVARFIEKPGYSVAREIIDAGGLWNTFIMVASARTLLDLFLPRYAALVMEMQVSLAKGQTAGSPTGSWPALLSLYDRLPELDFSRDLLEGHAADLCVLRVPPCGWSDLGTPRRVGEIVQRFAPDGAADRDLTDRPRVSVHMSLAAQHARLMSTNAQSDQLRLAR
ncbi:MAG TPA: sugar phosphate nucleotidyltransferase [Steroidobacteraceae bacterium]|nr:sugar phosphate nucleotidyltransferase [Steroidobacteraceae bacterium]